MASLNELYKSIFYSLLNFRDLGFEGTRVFTGPQKGPKVAALAMTHGNEPVGLGLVSFLEKTRLTQGEFWLILGNISAASRYFESSAQESHKFRGLNFNFNRLSPDLLRTEDPEAARLKKILQTLASADYILDFHSTSLPAPTMIIPNLAAQSSNFQEIMNAEVVLTNIISHMRYKPIIGHFNLPGIVIECGPHESKSSFDFALQFTETLLARFDMIPNKTVSKSKAKRPEVFEVKEAVWFPSNDFEMVKDFHNFELVQQNQPIAASKKTNQQILAPEDCYIVFPFPKGKEKGTLEEAYFLAKKGITSP